MHEQIVDLNKATAGLIDGYIVINETRLGPALGGTRIARYKSSASALADAKRLGAMMSKKTLIAGLPFGGGKGVINGDPKRVRTPKLLKAYAEVVKSLQGKFYTGEDAGLEEKDVQYMLKFSPYFVGKRGLAGDPSAFAAQSAFLCLKMAIRKVFGKTTCRNLTFGIKGFGKTGSVLAKLIYSDGGRLVITDSDPGKVSLALTALPGSTACSPTDIHTAPTDVFVPCALGDEVTTKTAPLIRAKLICGTANNQLADTTMHRELKKRGIVHIPDYIANAGGVINVADELLPGGYNPKRVEQEINNLAKILGRVWKRAEEQDLDLDTAAEDEIRLLFQQSNYVRV